MKHKNMVNINTIYIHLHCLTMLQFHKNEQPDFQKCGLKLVKRNNKQINSNLSPAKIKNYEMQIHYKGAIYKLKCKVDIE